MKPYVALDIIKSMQPLPVLRFRGAENKFGSFRYFSYLCIVKEIVYIYESNK